MNTGTNGDSVNGGKTKADALLLKSLRDIGAEAYKEAFVRENIGVDILPSLTDADLRALGIPLGDRKRILARLAQFQMPSEAMPIQADRRVLTILFVDLVGSTRLSEIMDIEDYRALLVEYQHAVGAVVRDAGGFLARAIGDGLLCYFGYPRSHESDALNAASAALRMPAAVAKLKLPGGMQPQTRCGLATGPAIVDDATTLLPLERNQSFGEAPNLAARLQGLAEPNGTVLCERTRRLIAGHFACRDLPPTQLKGFSRAERPSALLERLRTPTRFDARAVGGLTTFTNRTSELAALSRLWTRAESFFGTGVVLRGEPGIGKSHLIHEFLRRARVPEPSRLHLQCDIANSGRPLHPLVALLDAFTATHTEARLVDRLAHLASRAGPQPDNLAQILRFLIAPAGEAPDTIDAEEAAALREASFRLVVDVINGLQQTRPMVIVLEDAHWIDPSSEALLAEIIARLSGWQVLLIITSRSDHPLPDTMAELEQITLEPLSEADSAKLVEELLEDRQLAPDLLRHLLRRNEGVPLFLEELTRAVLDDPAVVERDGTLYLDTNDDGMQDLPTTLMGSLLARLDRRPGTRPTLAAASAIGREFPLGLLAKIIGDATGNLEQTLADLIDARILHKLPDSGVYRFHHALIQDAAYQTLLRSARREIHGRIARALSAPGDATPTGPHQQAGNAPHIVARHFQLAGNIERAYPFWLRAIGEAQARSAHFEAITLCETTLSALKDTAGTEAAIQSEIEVRELLYLSQEATAWGSTTIRGNLSAIDTLRRELTEQPISIAVLHGNAGGHLLNGEIAKAVRIAEELAALEPQQGPATAVLGQKLLGIAKIYQGRYDDAAAHFDLALTAIARDTEEETRRYYHADAKLVCQVFLAWAKALDGDAQTARDLLARASETLSALSDDPSRAYGYAVMACVHQTLGDAAEARDIASRALSIAEQRQLHYWIAWSQIVEGWAIANLGEVDAGTTKIEAGIAAYVATGTAQFLPYAKLLLAEVHLLAGRSARADAVADELETHGIGEMRHVVAPLNALRQRIAAAR